MSRTIRASLHAPTRPVAQGQPSSDRPEVTFVDPAVSHVDVLLTGLRPGVEGILLNSFEPAPRQMTRARVSSACPDVATCGCEKHGGSASHLPRKAFKSKPAFRAPERVL
jgi:hypothetical protein